MKRLVLGILILVSLLEARNMQYGERYGTSSGYNNNQNNYQGNSGKTYQYDMNNQNDRQQYSIDTGAQMRDNSANGYVDRFYDNALGQHGGGINGN